MQILAKILTSKAITLEVASSHTTAGKSKIRAKGGGEGSDEASLYFADI